MKIYSIKDKLPPTNKYVLVHLNKDNYGQDKGQYWTVAIMTKGISQEERSMMRDKSKRKKEYKHGDEWGNNLVPYQFSSFGPSSYFGQEVDYWCHLPNIED